MGNVPAIPESTRSSITLRILLHAKDTGQTGGPAGHLRDGSPTPRRRLPAASRGPCSASVSEARPFLGFALYSHAADARRFRPAHRQPGRRPQKRFDAACTLFFAYVQRRTGP